MQATPLTATLPPNLDTRDCHLYRFWVRHPVTGQRVLGYIGETVRLPFERLMEHVMSQPWADTILAWEVDDVIYCGKAAVLEAEQAAVERERPLYNYEWNLGNPRRVEIWRAEEQRWARDDAAGRRRWVKPGRAPRNASRPGPRPAERPASATRTWRAVQVRAAVWSAAWLVIAGVMWGEVLRLGLLATWTTALPFGCLAATGLCLWGRFRRPDTWKVWRRRFWVTRRFLRKARRWLR